MLFEYVWLGKNGEFRSKTRVLNIFGFVTLSKIPEWNYDGSSTNQIIEGLNTEIILKPCAIFKCPFRRGTNGHKSFIVLCDIYDVNGTPHPDNKRVGAKKIFDKYLKSAPWYGYEQEYFIIDFHTTKKVQFQNVEQGNFYCANGKQNIFHRQFVEEHLEHCLYAGLTVSGINAEVAPGQWEFQIGPVEGINSCDQLLVARYILVRLGEKHGVKISFHPKPFSEYNGSGCHTNFSTVETRRNEGYDAIVNSMPKFEKRHDNHIKVYGSDNDKRLTGIHETAPLDKFSWGIGTRNTSIRIGNLVKKEGKGYFEDRRPASNMDPYEVASIILETFYSDI